MASKPTPFAAILGGVKAATSETASSASPAERSQVPSKVSKPCSTCPEAIGDAQPATSSSLGSISPYNERRENACHDTKRPTSHSPSGHCLLNYGLPTGAHAQAPTRASAPLRDAHRSPSPRSAHLTRPTGDFYRPGPTSRLPCNDRQRGDADPNRGGDPYRRDYTHNATPPPPRARWHQAIPPWAERESHEADWILAELQKKDNHKNQTVSQQTPKTHQRTADIYRPTQKKTQEPKMLNDYAAYSSWSKYSLLREVNLRCLHYENEDHPYLVNILMINDRKFFEMCQEFRHLHTTKALLEEAKLQNVIIDESKRWDQYALMTKIADQLARNAVSQHNDLLRAEQVAQRGALKKQSPHTQARPSKVNSVPKVLHKGVKVKDRASLKKAPWADTEEKSPESAKKENTSGSGYQKNVFASKSKKPQNTASKEAKSKVDTMSKANKSTARNSEGTDSGYSTGHLKLSRSPKSSDHEDGDYDLSMNRSKERLIRFNSDHDAQNPPAGDIQGEHTKNKKRARPLELEKETKEETSKRVKVKPTPNDEVEPSTNKAQLMQQCASITSDHSGEMEIYSKSSTPKPQPIKAGLLKDQSPKEEAEPVMKNAIKQDKEAEEVVATARKTFQKHKSRADEDDKDLHQVLSKKVRQDPTNTSRQQKPLKGISDDKRIPGMMYVQCTDGSYELKKAKKPSARAGDPAKRFIK